jgi:hypothetical protein
MHTKPAMQSLLLVQLSMQAPLAQTYGSQAAVVGGRHKPAPLHTGGSTTA